MRLRHVDVDGVRVTLFPFWDGQLTHLAELHIGNLPSAYLPRCWPPWEVAARGQVVNEAPTCLWCITDRRRS